MSIAFYRIVAALLALGIFLFDILSPLEGAVAVLYALVVLVAARTCRRADVFAASAGTATLTMLAYVLSHSLETGASPALRVLVSLSAIGIATALALQSQAATATLVAQAKLINLSHDMIFMRDLGGVISFWNDAAEQVYGWPAEEAIGRVADDLLRTRYPEDRGTIEDSLLRSGRWEGILEQETRSGARLILDSRWAVQHDGQGKPAGVLETHTDITERQAAHAALVRSEHRYRRMFVSSRIGVIEEDWSGLREELAAVLEDSNMNLERLGSASGVYSRARRRIKIVDVNPAFLSIISPKDPKPLLRTVDDIIYDTDRAFGGAMAAFMRGDTFYEGETELKGSGGRTIPVFFAITFPTSQEDGDHVLVYVVDITDRRLAQEALEQTHAELAHATRVATLGELTASIAHEVSQPLMAVVTSGEAGRRWLRRAPPDLSEVEATLDRVVAEGRRASDIVTRIRAFLKKAPSHRGELALSSLVEDATALVARELASADVRLEVDISPHLPAVHGDRIQLQQVLVNLMVNAVHAMTGQEKQRLLSVGAVLAAPESIEIIVRDTGPGIWAEHQQRLFEPFFSTKKDGLGMGLPICRTTAEAHGGSLTVESELGQGSVFRLRLPAYSANALGERTMRVEL